MGNCRTQSIKIIKFIKARERSSKIIITHIFMDSSPTLGSAAYLTHKNECKYSSRGWSIQNMHVVVLMACVQNKVEDSLVTSSGGRCSEMDKCLFRKTEWHKILY